MKVESDTWWVPALTLPPAPCLQSSPHHTQGFYPLPFMSALLPCSPQSVPNWIGTLALEKSPARRRTSAIGQTCKLLAPTNWEGDGGWGGLWLLGIGLLSTSLFFFFSFYSLHLERGCIVRSAPSHSQHWTRPFIFNANVINNLQMWNQKFCRGYYTH